MIDDLAMIAQIDAAKRRMQQRMTDAERDAQFHARGLHRFPLRGLEQAARAEVVHHRPTSHAARRGSHERIGHAAAVAIRQPDVEQHMHVFLRRVDVGDERGDGRVRVFHQPRRVAGHGFKPADRTTNVKQVRVALGNLRAQVGHISRRAGSGWRNSAFDGAHPRDPPAPDVHLAKHHVGQHADQRQGDDHRQPRDARRWFAMRPQHHAHEHGDMQRRAGGQRQAGEGHRNGCPRFTLESVQVQLRPQRMRMGAT